MEKKNNNILVSSILILVAVGLLFPIYNSAIWWVSLEAPNYPEEAFPDGVRILFHLNGVFNGCQLMEKAEIASDEALDCVHEMDTINHYVGMYPIAAGGPVELFFSIFLLALVGVMLIGYVIQKPMIRTIVMGSGFLLLAIWMSMTWFGADGIKYHNGNYLEGRITVLGEEAEIDDVDDGNLAGLRAAMEGETARLPSGMSAFEALKASIAGEEIKIEEDGVVVVEEAVAAEELTGKANSIAYMKDAFKAYQERKGSEPEEWNGSGKQFMSWHYEKSLGKYFRGEDALMPMVSKVSNAGNVIFWGVIGIMILLLVVARKPEGFFNWLLVAVPIGLPLYFVIEYVTWLWWYGHNMNSMGAFSLKAFMPTAFGQGKVAQFTTNSYPYTGFWMLVLFSALLVIAVYLRTRRDSDVAEEEE
ncbi:MAG: hypothetical protein GY752_11745 [bacterium]|nr:hypothetical protein [bacterium]MCP4799286.1 hypothetical protein [bacterium]